MSVEQKDWQFEEDRMLRELRKMTNTKETIAKKRAILLIILEFFKRNTDSLVMVSHSLKVCFFISGLLGQMFTLPFAVTFKNNSETLNCNFFR